MTKMLSWKYVHHIVVLWLRLDSDSRHIYTEDDNDLKDKVKTLTILYFTHRPMVMQVKLNQSKTFSAHFPKTFDR